MNLLDHFHPPLSAARHWESFHSAWATFIAAQLNAGLLPKDYYAEETVHVGSRIEVDVATFEEDDFFSGDEAIGGSTATAVVTAPKVWTPPLATLEFPAVFPDSIEVLIINSEAGPTLVAAIELVSPGNKDREENRKAFAEKCASYMQQGVGVVVVDIVTSRRVNLHNELVKLLEVGDQFRMPNKSTYVVSYRPVRRRKAEKISAWTNLLKVGEVLPTVPLPLGRRLLLPLDFNASYTEACERKRLG